MQDNSRKQGQNMTQVMKEIKTTKPKIEINPTKAKNTMNNEKTKVEVKKLKLL